MNPLSVISFVLIALQACSTAQAPVADQSADHLKKKSTVNGLEKEGSAPSKDVNIHYYQFGKADAPPLLIINGGPGMNCEGFKGIAQLLADDYRCIIFDQRGTGQSELAELSAENLTMDLMVEDMENLREHLGLDSWSVLGQSFGGMLASYYATKHPESIEAMVLSSSGGISLKLLGSLNITGRLSELERDSLSYWRNKIQQGDTSYHAAYQRGKYLAPAYLYNRDYIPQIAERLTQGNMQVNRLVFQHMQAMNFDCTAGLSNYKKPVLIIQGKQDIISEALAQEAKAALPQAKVVILDRCGHYGWLDRKEAYLKAVKVLLG